MNNSTVSVPWFEKEKRVFKNPLNHHAYIFEGVEGIGKTVFTLEIAKGFLCNSLPGAEACNQCHLVVYLINLTILTST